MYFVPGARLFTTAFPVVQSGNITFVKAKVLGRDQIKGNIKTLKLMTVIGSNES